MISKPAGNPRVLVVCTGNICRSPLAAQYLAFSFPEVSVTLDTVSAGVQPVLGGEIPAELVAAAQNRGHLLQAHTPQLLTKSLVDEADLILTAERFHRGEVLSLAPLASRRTFTLKQFERISAAYVDDDEFVVGQGFTEFVDAVADFRAAVPAPQNGADDDLPDPFRKSVELYQASEDEIFRTISSILTSLGRAT
jgi:protein-tyrosine phosphatase